MTLYEAVLNHGLEYDHHASDLYLPDDEKSRDLISKYFEFICNITRFRSQIDKKVWLNIPFAYDPWWTARQK